MRVTLILTLTPDLTLYNVLIIDNAGKLTQ